MHTSSPRADPALDAVGALALACLLVLSVVAGSLTLAGVAAGAVNQNSQSDTTIGLRAASQPGDVVESGSNIEVNVSNVTGSPSTVKVALESATENPTNTNISTSGATTGPTALFTGVILDGYGNDDDVTVGTNGTNAAEIWTDGATNNLAITANDNGTFTVYATSGLQAGTTVTLRGDARPDEVAELTDTGSGYEDASVPLRAVPSGGTPGDGTLQVQERQSQGADGTFSAIFVNTSATGSGAFETRVSTGYDAQSGAPNTPYVTEYVNYTSGGSAIPTLEIAFAQDVYRADTPAGTDADLTSANVSVYADGEEVSLQNVRMRSDNGALVAELGRDLDPVENVTYTLSTVRDDAGRTFDPSENQSVTVTGQTADNVGQRSDGTTAANATAFEGTTVAILDDQASPQDLERQSTFSVSGGGQVSIAENSKVGLLPTDSLSPGTYRLSRASGGSDDLNVTVQEMSISASARETSVFAGESFTVEGEVTSSGIGVGSEPLYAELTFAGDVEDTAAATTNRDGTYDLSLQPPLEQQGRYNVTVYHNYSLTNASTRPINVTADIDEPVTVSQFANRVDRGMVGDIPVRILGTNDTASLTIGHPSTGYVANLTLVDGDNDGEVVVRLNTYTLGPNGGPNDDAYFPADSDDDVVVNDTDTLDGVLDVAAYDLRAQEGAGVHGFDSERDAMLAIDPHRPAGTRIQTAPIDANVTTIEQVETKPGDDTIAEGDYLIVAINGSGLEGPLAATGPNGRVPDDGEVTGRFFAMLDAPATSDAPVANFSIVQNETGPNTLPRRLDVTDATVFWNRTSEMLYVRYDTNAISVYRDSNDDGSLQPAETIGVGVSPDTGPYRVSFALDNRTEYIPASGTGDEYRNASVQFREREATVDRRGDTVELSRIGSQRLVGSTTLAEGTELTVRAQSLNRTSLFRVTRDVTVTDRGDGTVWSTSFDLSTVPRGTNFTLQVTGPGSQQDPLIDTDGVVVEHPPPSVSFTDKQPRGDLTVDRVYLPQGGFVVVVGGSSPGGSVVGRSSYLPAGGYVDVSVGSPPQEGTVLTAFIVRDVNNDRAFQASTDVPYRDDQGNIVADSMRLDLVATAVGDSGEQTAVAPVPETASDDSAPEPTQTTASTTTSTGDTETAADGSGFGAVAALLAVLVGLLVARRRP